MNLCESCTIKVVSKLRSDLFLGHSRKSQKRVCECCHEQISYEYVFERVSPLEVAKMEAM